MNVQNRERVDDVEEASLRDRRFWRFLLTTASAFLVASFVLGRLLSPPWDRAAAAATVVLVAAAAGDRSTRKSRVLFFAALTAIAVLAFETMLHRLWPAG